MAFKFSGKSVLFSVTAMKSSAWRHLFLDLTVPTLVKVKLLQKADFNPNVYHWLLCKIEKWCPDGICFDPLVPKVACGIDLNPVHIFNNKDVSRLHQFVSTWGIPPVMTGVKAILL